MVGFVTATGFSIFTGATLIFDNLNIQLKADSPVGSDGYGSFADSIVYGDRASTLHLKQCFITDNRNYPDTDPNGRSLFIAGPLNSVGTPNVNLTVTTVVVVGRPAADYSAIFREIASLRQVSCSTIDSGWGVATMADNIYSVMYTYGENKILRDVIRDSRGDVLIPISDYPNFT